MIQRNFSKYTPSIAIFVSLVALIVAGRYFPHLANFTPVAAAGLFAGYIFRSRVLALSVPLLGMLLSDVLFAGSYNMGVMVIVYLAIATPALAGNWLRKPSNSNLKQAAKVMIGAGGGAILFFLSTNFADYMFSGMYAHNFTGLIACYTAAVPFFKWTLLGDLAFATILFGGYALVMRAQARNITASQAA